MGTQLAAGRQPAIRPGALTVVEVRDRAGLEALRDEWRALTDASPHATIFETWDWVATWIDHFWGDRPLALQVVRRGDALAGVAPLLRDVQGDMWTPGSLALPVNPHAKWADVAHDGDADGVLSAVVRATRRRHPGMALGMPRVLADSPTRAAVHRLALLLGLSVRARKAPGALSVRNVAGWAGWEARLDKKVRHELRRKARRIQGGRRVAWKTATRPEQVDAALRDVFHIEARSWKAEAGTSLDTEPGADGFYTDLARRLARTGALRLHLLFVDERPVAHLYGAAFGGRLYALKTSYDARHRRLSPGQVVVRQAIRHAFEEGLESFELLGAPSRWKEEIADEARDLESLCLFSPSNLRCRWCVARDQHLKPLARRLIRTATALVPIIGSIG